MLTEQEKVWLICIPLFGWGAWLTWTFIFQVHPVSGVPWDQTTLLFGLAWFSGPLIAAAISAVALCLRKSASRLLKWVIVSHAAICASMVAIGWVQHILPLLVGGLFAVLVDVPFLMVLLATFKPPAAAKRLQLTIAGSVGCTAAVVVVWSVLNIAIVEWRAAAVADQNPYCLQVSHLGGYREVTQHRQLRGLRMQTPFTMAGTSDKQFEFHAVLVVKTESAVQFYNWSYRAQSFLPVKDRTRQALRFGEACSPTVGFASSLV